MQQTVKTLREFAQMIEETLIVLVREETRLPVVPALDYVHWEFGRLEAGFARHKFLYTTVSTFLLKGSVPIYSSPQHPACEGSPQGCPQMPGWGQE